MGGSSLKNHIHSRMEAHTRRQRDRAFYFLESPVFWFTSPQRKSTLPTVAMRCDDCKHQGTWTKWVNSAVHLISSRFSSQCMQIAWRHVVGDVYSFHEYCCQFSSQLNNISFFFFQNNLPNLKFSSISASNTHACFHVSDLKLCCHVGRMMTCTTVSIHKSHWKSGYVLPELSYILFIRSTLGTC